MFQALRLWRKTIFGPPFYRLHNLGGSHISKDNIMSPKDIEYLIYNTIEHKSFYESFENKMAILPRKFREGMSLDFESIQSYSCLMEG